MDKRQSMVEGIKKRLYILLTSILLTIMGGGTGYYAIFMGERSFLDCVYMTVISLTSVGYGEVVPVTGNPLAQFYTMGLLIFGMGIILYAISSFTAILIEGELSGMLRRNKMERKIRSLKRHYIVCGGGETGLPLIEEIVKNKEEAVLIDFDPDSAAHHQFRDSILYIRGDATDDHNLISAGIDHAAGIIISLPSDKDNLYITMTARMLNPKIRIISRMTNPKMRDKLIKAGADGVVSPNFIGALRMASEMLRPVTVSFLDTMLRSGDGTIRIHDVQITGKSHFSGKKIIDLSLNKKHDLLLLGLKTDSEMLFNPSEETELKEGMTLIVMGKSADISKAKNQIS